MPATVPRLLIIDDDPALCMGLLEYFRAAHFAPTTTSDADTALRYLRQPPGYDIALLDIDLRGTSGFALLEALQQTSIDTAVLIISGRSALSHRLRGFRLGAQDYLTKPFALDELKARVDVILERRSSSPAHRDGPPSREGLTLDPALKSCFRGSTRLPLTALEYRLLAYLAARPGRVISREGLRRALWTEDASISLRTIDRHIAKIREKIEPHPQNPLYLRTVYGKGYEFTVADAFPHPVGAPE